MGAAMVRRLRAAGADVVVLQPDGGPGAEAVAARDRRRRRRPRPREAAGAAPVVLVSLADDQALRCPYGGPTASSPGSRPGAVVAETSTVDPATVQRLAP